MSSTTGGSSRTKVRVYLTFFYLMKKGIAARSESNSVCQEPPLQDYIGRHVRLIRKIRSRPSDAHWDRQGDPWYCLHCIWRYIRCKKRVWTSFWIQPFGTLSTVHLLEPRKGCLSQIECFCKYSQRSFHSTSDINEFFCNKYWLISHLKPARLSPALQRQARDQTFIVNSWLFISCLLTFTNCR